MTRKTQLLSLLTAAAVAGISAGAATQLQAAAPAQSGAAHVQLTPTAAGHLAGSIMLGDMGDKDSCKGKSSCKGKDGCGGKSDDKPTTKTM